VANGIGREATVVGIVISILALPSAATK
jgi:hypothetical protein